MMHPDRPDLAALLARLLVMVRSHEEPILAAHDLSMWDYVVLTFLASTPAPTQAELARETGRDKTRLISNLDRLEALKLVHRRPDPADRRNRIVTITPAGSSLHARCRKAIREMESELLADLPASRRRQLLDDLAIVTPHSAPPLTDPVQDSRDHDAGAPRRCRIGPSRRSGYRALP